MGETRRVWDWFDLRVARPRRLRTARPVFARHGGAGGDGHVNAEIGALWHGRLGWASLGGLGSAHHGMAGVARHVHATQGRAQLGRPDGDGRAWAHLRTALQAWPVTARHHIGGAPHGEAGSSCRGHARNGWAGGAWLGADRQIPVRIGMSRQADQFEAGI